MKPIDLLKALGAAALILALDVLVAIGAVFVWAQVKGLHDPAVYQSDAAYGVARWSTRIVGTTLIFAASLMLAVRRPERNRYLFALLVALSYSLLDAASNGFSGVLTAGFAFTQALKLAAALGGAWLAGAVKTRF